MGNQILSGKRVLVVEDEMLVLMAIKDMMGDLGCTSVTVAGSVETALDLIETGVFDVATLDLNLHGQRSYPVADALSRRDIPFAVSTGYGEHGVSEGYGNRLVRNKPYDSPQLAKVLVELLGQGELRLLPLEVQGSASV